MVMENRPVDPGSIQGSHRCWTYSHHCQIADMKPSKRSWNGQNFGGFVYVLDGFPQRDFVLWVFMCPTNVSLFCVYSVTIYIARAITRRAITPLPPLLGYHAEGYHVPSLPPRAITPVYTSRFRHPSYHASNKLLGTGRLSHLRVVFIYGNNQERVYPVVK